MTKIDLVLGIVLLAFFLWGTSRGLLWAVVRLASFAGVIWGISLFGEEVRYQIGDFLGVSPAIATLFAYILIFILLMILSSLIYKFILKLLKTLKLSLFNRLAGGVLFGAGFFLLAAMLVILVDLSPYSLNGRGIRPQNHRANLSSLSKTIEKEVNKQISLSDFDADKIWEAVDKANKRFLQAKNPQERQLALDELWKSLQNSLDENGFDQFYQNVQKSWKKSISFEGKDIFLPSWLLNYIIEPAADTIESRILGFEII